MDAGDGLRMIDREDLGEDAAAVAAGDRVPRVAEHTGHERVEDPRAVPRRLLRRHRRRAGEAEPRQRRDHHVEVLGERGEDLQVADEGVRPPVEEEQGRPAGLRVHEVHVGAEDPRLPVRELAQARLLRPPVVAGAPVRDELAEISTVGAALPAVVGARRPARPLEPGLQVLEHGRRHMDSKRFHRIHTEPGPGRPAVRSRGATAVGVFDETQDGRCTTWRSRPGS